MIKTSQLLAVISMFNQAIIASSLCFKSTGFDSASFVVPYYKSKVGIDPPVYEDRAISTKKLLMVSDGVGGSSSPSGPIADSLVVEIAKDIYQNLLNPKHKNNKSKKRQSLDLNKNLLFQYIQNAVGKYNNNLKSLSFDIKETTATLAGSLIEKKESKNYHTVFQYGDSLTMILEKFENENGAYMSPKIRTELKQHSFNQPYQISEDKSLINKDHIMLIQENADLHDIVIVGSDGIFDNFPDALIGIAVNYLLIMLELHVKRYNSLYNFKPGDLLVNLLDDYSTFIKKTQDKYINDLLSEKKQKSSEFIQKGEKPIKSGQIGKKPIKSDQKGKKPIKSDQKGKKPIKSGQKGKNKQGNNNSNQQKNESEKQEPEEAKMKPCKISERDWIELRFYDVHNKQAHDNKKEALGFVDLEKTVDEDDIKANNKDKSAQDCLYEEPNFFEINNCGIELLFEYKYGDDKKQHNKCINKILNDMTFDMKLVELYYDPQLVASAMAEGVKYFYDKHKDVLSNFAKHEAQAEEIKNIRSKPDDVGISMSLVVKDTANDELEDIKANIELRRKKTLNELKSYKLSSDSNRFNKLI